MLELSLSKRGMKTMSLILLLENLLPRARQLIVYLILFKKLDEIFGASFFYLLNCEIFYDLK